MTGLFKIIFLQLFIVFILGCSTENNSIPVIEEFEFIYKCSAEDVDKASYSFYEASGDSLTFGNVNARSNEVALTGEFSLKLTPEISYGFTTEYSVGPDEYIQVSAWRKCTGDDGAIGIGSEGKLFDASRHVVEERPDGWQKIFIEMFSPPHIAENNLTIFVWNIGKDTVYFDDIEIIHRNGKKYPEYNPQTALQIYTDEENLNYFNQKRLEAFQTKILENNDEDFAGAVIFNGNEFLNAEIRLKGDLTDHIQGDKWSFRIKLDKEFTWNHVRTFSVHNPATRNFLHEWLAHKIFIREDILTTRYGLVPLVLNNQSKGIYAWEEHFEKNLLESSNRREGPIVRFDETLFWKRMKENNRTGNLMEVDYFGAAKITPFKESQIISDSMKIQQAVEAQKLLLQYKKYTAPVSQIIDVESLARYYALMDVTQAYHGFTWHNRRYYFNPVTCLLEPIAFDGYVEGGIFKRFEEPAVGLINPEKLDTLQEEELLLYQVFTDSIFNRKYLHYLKIYADSSYIEKIIKEFKPAGDSLTLLIKREFPYYDFKFDYIRSQAKIINENLVAIEKNIPGLGEKFKLVSRNKFKKSFTAEVNADITPLLIHAYYDRNSNKVEILNYHAAQIAIIGSLINNNLPEYYNSEILVDANDGIIPGRILLEVKGEPYKIIFSVAGELLEVEVEMWPFIEGLSPRQELQISNDLPELPWRGDSLVFDGNYLFKNDVYIPQGKKVVLKSGTSINLVNGAGFFSFSAIHAEGTENSPVEFLSSNQNSQGVHVLQAANRSVLKYTTFTHLGNIRKGGWQTPSAVTFYEADVDIYNCTFEANVNCDDALNIVRSDFHVENCTFINTFADAFDSDFCTGNVVDCKFQYIGNDAIDFSGSGVTISGCEMYEVNDKAISGGENSKLLVEDCIIEKATIAVASKDSSHVKVNNLEIFKTVYGFVSFVKKPEYGPAVIEVENIKMRRIMVFHKIEEGSVLIFNENKINGREKNLALKLYQ